MATLVANPDVVEFLDRLSIHGDEPTNLEEIICGNITQGNCEFTIREIGIRSKTGANIIGVKTEEGDFILNPTSDVKINKDTKLFVLGTFEQIEEMKEIITKELA